MEIMKCNEIRELLPDLAAGFVAAKPEVNDHLRSCADCAGTLAEFRKTMALLDEWEAPEPSPYFDTRLHARLRDEAVQQRSRWASWISLRRAALAVSLAAVVIVGAAVLRLQEKKFHHRNVTVATIAQPGTPVGDLQALDQNQDIYSDSDLLDDLQVQQDVNANP
jgi:hypothetical protein